MQLEELMEENQRLKATLKDKDKLQREMFMKKVFKNDDNIKRYTGIVNKNVFYGLLDFIKSTSEW